MILGIVVYHILDHPPTKDMLEGEIIDMERLMDPCPLFNNY